MKCPLLFPAAALPAPVITRVEAASATAVAAMAAYLG